MTAIKRAGRFGVAILLIAALMVGCQKSTLEQLKEQLELGQNYLLEMKYEEAVVAFEKAIELEPKNWDAYQGLTNVYVAQGQYDAAMEVLNRAEKNLPEVAAISQMREELPRRITEVTLSQWSGSEDWEMIYAQMESNENHNLFLDLDKPVITIDENGRGMGIYPSDEGLLLYIGGYENGMRSGYGIFGNMGTDEYGPYKYIYEGEWAQDYPNGEGTITYIYADEVDDGDGLRLEHVQNIIHGTFKDGWYDGKITDIYISDIEGTDTYIYHVENGYPEIIGIDEEVREIGDPYFYMIAEQSQEGGPGLTVSENERFWFAYACKGIQE